MNKTYLVRQLVKTMANAVKGTEHIVFLWPDAVTIADFTATLEDLIDTDELREELALSLKANQIQLIRSGQENSILGFHRLGITGSIYTLEITPEFLLVKYASDRQASREIHEKYLEW